MKIFPRVIFSALLFASLISDGVSEFLATSHGIDSHYYNHYDNGKVTWNYGKKGNNGGKKSQKLKEDKDQCKDNSPYCSRFVKVYGLDPPFTICDQDWFTKSDGYYGCRKACDLC